MNNKPSDASESLWRRKLSPAERATLRSQPEADLDARLTEVLAQIPDAPVPSNFTARVLNAIELEEARATRPGWRWNWRSLLPRMAVATAVLVFTGVSIQRYEDYSHRAELGKNVALVAVAQPLPNLEALENLEIIQRMGQSAHADGELLAALQ